MRYNQEQINIPEKLSYVQQQDYRERLYFENELRKLVPDLIRAEYYGYLCDSKKRWFDYYTKDKPEEKKRSCFAIRNGIVSFPELAGK